MSDTSTPALPEPARRFAIARPKVPPFARFKGTSAWVKDRRRAREYARFRAAEKQMNQSAATPNP